MSQNPEFPPQAPPTGLYQAQPENGVGLAAMIVGIASFVMLAPLSSTAAIILGVMGLGRARQGRATNRGQALAGLICGIVTLVLGLIGIIIVIAVFSARHGSST
ncbi:MAG TPA: DUF4190 domain-containing protein [Oryzihumus sp.]|nr:DUF4190 domain-containing protein [Oryzihumus sp.]